MTLRNKKLLSLLLATAMVFTMNTSVFALEVGEDADEEYTVDFVDDSSEFEESEGAAEVDSVETDDFAFVDEIDGLGFDSEGAVDYNSDAAKKVAASANKLGWTIGGENGPVEGTLIDTTKKEITLGGKVSLAGDIDSEDILISPSNATKGELSLTVDGSDNSGASVTVTLMSSNTAINIDDAGKIRSGYGYVNGYKGDSKEQLAAWAEALAGTKIMDVSIDDSNISNADSTKSKLVVKFSFSEDDAKDNNQPFGLDTKTAGSATVTYYKNIPFCGKGTLKTNIEKAFGMKISGNGVNYKIKSISVKFNKGTATATIKKVTLDKSVGTKENRKAIEKALKRSITLTCYPYNLSAGGVTYRKANKKNTKLTVKINGKKITVTNGKSDNYGGTPKLTLSNNKILVENSKILKGLG